MFKSYKDLFAQEGALAFVGAALIARMPVSMISIAILTMLSMVYDSYRLAGMVTAAFALSSSLLAPQISRIVDIYGQGRVLPRASVVCFSGLVALLLCVHFRLPEWSLYPAAILSGCLPNMSAMSRARWTEIYRGKPQLNAAFSLEAVFDEACFVIGPPFSVFLCAALFPEAGILAAALLLVLGVSLFASQRRTEPPIYPRCGSGGAKELFSAALFPLLLALFGLGLIVGAVDVVAVAFAREVGQPGMAGVVLSIYALTSCFAGLVYGGLHPKASLPSIFLFTCAATAVTTLPMLLADKLWILCVAVAVSGVFFAPTMITAMRLVERLTPPSRLTEGMTWMITGLVAGIASGAAMSGWAADHWGAQSSFIVAVCAGGLMLAASLGGRPILKKRLKA